MVFYFNFMLLLLNLPRINSFLLISMEVIYVDDCIRQILLEDGTILYNRGSAECLLGNYNYNRPIFNQIPYDFDEKIKIVIGDIGGVCGLNMKVYVNNNNIIKTSDSQFWSCDNCASKFNNGNSVFYCYPAKSRKYNSNYNYNFKINSLSQLSFQAYEYFYFLNNANHIYISSPNLNNAINLIDLHSKNNLYAKNLLGDSIEPFYNYIYYKLSFDRLDNHTGKFFGSDNSNNDIELNENVYSRIIANKNLRYKLSDKEKENRGVHLRLKLGIYNNQKNLITDLHNFNITICLKDYLFCDIGTPLDCFCGLKEETEETMEKMRKYYEIKRYDNILKDYEKLFTSKNFDPSNIDTGNDVINKTGKMTITLTSIENQKNSDNNDGLSKVNIGPCEEILRNAYKISPEKKLYMKKIDVVQEGMKVPKIEYDIYCNLNGNNLVKLNKSYCYNVKAEISVHILLSEDIDKLNMSSGYYNDICYTSKSDSGTDISLKDRKNDFLNDNKTICQDGCVFSKYDYNKSKAICSCDIEETSTSFAFMKISKEKLLSNFIDIKNIANINILKCYKLLFSIEGIKGNIGFLAISILILLHFIFLIILCIKNFDTIKKIINDIFFGIKNWKFVKEDDIAKKLKMNKEKINIRKPNTVKMKMKLKNKNKKANPPIKGKIINKIKVVKNNFKFINNNQFNNLNKRKTPNLKNELSKKKFIIQRARKIMAYNDEELNQLPYNLALKNDNRTYCQFYCSLIKTRHNLIFSFCYSKDYNSRIIKIDAFFISFILDFTVNVLFFDDDTMHKIYEDKGKFDFLYQLPKILYTTVITFVLDTPLKSLALSDNYISDFKNNKSDKNLNKRYAELYKKLKIILLLFFLISSIFLLAFWYYISMFCAIYRNTQIHLIKDTLISFGTAFLYPFGLYLLPGIFRIPALSNKRNKRVCLYNMSKLFQMI